VTASRVKAGDNAETQNEVSANTWGYAAPEIREFGAPSLFDWERA